LSPEHPVDPSVSASSSELRAHIERVLNAHYELDVEIGRGGMGVVYRARDRRLKRHVAIKVLPPELAFQSAIKTRFLREAETAAQLSHPNIVPIYTVDELEGLVFFVMAYISGDNLAKRLHDTGVLGADDVRRITREVADALAYAHERGVVHRDIKPDNILLDAATGRTMVTDFGIARAASGGDAGRLTATGMAIGTPAYMSPEQAAGDREIDGRSDLYSLGIVAYQMLVGEPPFVANSTPAMLVKHISERPTPVTQRRSDIPQDLARAVMLLLEKDPATRFPSAASLVSALDGGHIPEARSSYEPAGVMVPARQTHGGTPNDEQYYRDGVYVPTPLEMQRWNAQDVVKFRKKVAPYLFVNAVIVLFAIVSDSDFFGLTVLWSIYMAFKYATLWSNGYDWRDVFRQPREKELIDVADEFLEYLKALFNRDKRKELRDRNRARLVARRSGSSVQMRDLDLASPAGRDAAAAAGPHGDKVRQAATDRDEIVRLVGTLPDRERERVSDVVRSAGVLYDRVQSLAISLAEMEHGSGGGVAVLEAEIDRLEAEANPLDRGSEERVRRLAYLKRQRRGARDVEERRETIAAKLDTCSLALHQLKLDVLRLRAGAQTHQRVTSLALEALAMAENVDSALYVADEVARVSAAPRQTGQRQSARP
jgi:serine/threonine-protein kinase